MYRNDVEQPMGAQTASQTPQFVVQCDEIRKIISQLREKLVFVTVLEGGENKLSEVPRNGHINSELMDIHIQLKDLLKRIQY